MKLRAVSGAPEGLWLRAEQQSGGRGRLGREWHSPKGNLYVSSLVRLRDSDPPASSLAFVTAVAVHQQLSDCLNSDAANLKWPNDILVDGKKICGILLERVGDAVVIGIGVNISFAPELADRVVTCLHQEGADNRLTAEMFLTDLVEIFAKKLNQWRVHGLAATLRDWEARAHAVGSSLSVTESDGQKISGVYEGLDPTGALRLRKEDGTTITIHAGDVNLI